MSTSSSSVTTGDAAAPSSAASANSSRGTGSRQRGSRGGRQRNNTNPGTIGQQAATNRNRTAFKGNTEEMNGNVFECYEEQSDRRQFSKTIECLDAYTKKTLTYSADLASLFATKMAAPVVEHPVPIEGVLDKFSEIVFAEEAREWVKRNRALLSNLATVFAVAWGQCSEEMKLRLKTHDGYEASASANDCVWLFKTSGQ